MGQNENLGFGYCRLFDKDEGNFVETTGLIELGSSMVCENTLARASDDSRIPAGYTYLGQIVAHELSFDITQGFSNSPVEDDNLSNRRSPCIDLTSIYGGGPQSQDSVFYRSDGVRLRLGPVGIVGSPRWEDLPRTQLGGAIIGDERNDENLVTAQTAVAIMKFHNAVADHLDNKPDGQKATFEDVRNCTVRHFQSVVLHDFAWRIVPDEIYRDVMDNGRRLYYPDGLPTGSPMTIPIEFSHAAFRFGHSMVRSTYRWSKTIEFASPDAFFDKTGRNSRTGFVGLRGDWIVDWENFYPLPASLAHRKKEINYSRRIDTRLTRILAGLPPGELAHGEPPNLAVRDLLRGHSVNLPSGQQVARSCEQRYGIYTGRLSSNQLKRLGFGTTGAILERYGYDEHTPLWFYILAEAEAEQHGQSLGRIGGRIVMEVLHAAIEMAEPSIVDGQQWKPDLPGNHKTFYSMSDLISFAGNLSG